MCLQEKERKARRKGKAVQNEETSVPATEEEEMEGSGVSGNEEEAQEDGEGTNKHSLSLLCAH